MTRQRKPHPCRRLHSQGPNNQKRFIYALNMVRDALPIGVDFEKKRKSVSARIQIPPSGEISHDLEVMCRMRISLYGSKWRKYRSRGPRMRLVSRWTADHWTRRRHSEDCNREVMMSMKVDTVGREL